MSLIKLKTVNKVLTGIIVDVNNKTYEFFDNYQHEFNKVINELKWCNDKCGIDDMYKHLEPYYRTSKYVLRDVFDIVHWNFSNEYRNVIGNHYFKVLKLVSYIITTMVHM